MTKQQWLGWLTVGALGAAHASGVLTGLVHLGATHEAACHANGVVVMDGTEVSGTTQVQGTLTAHRATLRKTQVRGDAAFEASTLKGPVRVQGHLSGHDTTFQGAIHAQGNRMDLNHCEAASIRMQSRDDHPTIHLQGHTNVHGDVTFSGQPGEVHLESGSQVTGRVVHGQVVQPKG